MSAVPYHAMLISMQAARGQHSSVVSTLLNMRDCTMRERGVCARVALCGVEASSLVRPRRCATVM
eukprot:2126185-Lingulodinium_polyedra.AAC.1